MSTLYWSNCVKTFNRYEKCAVTALLKFEMDYISIFQNEAKTYFMVEDLAHKVHLYGLIVP